jgi:hypothetical protein
LQLTWLCAWLTLSRRIMAAFAFPCGRGAPPSPSSAARLLPG